MEHFQSWSDLVNPEFYIKLGGYWLVLFIIFAETGLFVGFFPPWGQSSLHFRYLCRTYGKGYLWLYR